MDREVKIIQVFSDGGSRGNPGMAACAFVVFVNNVIFHQESKYLGFTTNNDAEYQGLIMALNFLNTLDLSDYQQINIHLDSELIVNQLNGKYKVKNQKLKILYEKAINLINNLGVKVQIIHIPRSKNFLSDKLVNARLDGII
ncbi:MAG: ribonuclease HI family protein [Patescibacteria group bacterium]|nr:ribonuclease HI family protein [Patescibacteria group bacterium]